MAAARAVARVEEAKVEEAKVEVVTPEAREAVQVEQRRTPRPRLRSWSRRLRSPTHPVLCVLRSYSPPPRRRACHPRAPLRGQTPPRYASRAARVHIRRPRIRAVVVGGGGGLDVPRAAVFILRTDGERVARERHRPAKGVGALRVGRLDVRLEAPRRTACVARVHVDRARTQILSIARAVVIGGGGARHTRRAAVLTDRRDGEPPRRARPRVHVDRARTAAAVVGGGGARHARRAAVLTRRPHGERVARERHRPAKEVAGLRIGRLDVRLEAPCRARPRVHVGRARTEAAPAVVGGGGGALGPPRRARPRVHVDRARTAAAVVGGGGARHAHRAAGLIPRPHGERVARERHRPAKEVVALRIGRLDVRLEAPRRARPRVHVHRARHRAAVVGGGGGRHARRAAVLTRRPDGERVARER
eukprot:scaffold18569_cov71-Phaeocystis_antarctica.AAC.5